MWYLEGVTVRGKKPKCVKNRVCPYFFIDIGVKSMRANKNKPIFGCNLGQFRLTHRRRILPQTCNLKRRGYSYVSKDFRREGLQLVRKERVGVGV